MKIVPRSGCEICAIFTKTLLCCTMEVLEAALNMCISCEYFPICVAILIVVINVVVNMIATSSITDDDDDGDDTDDV